MPNLKPLADALASVQDGFVDIVTLVQALTAKTEEQKLRWHREGVAFSARTPQFEFLVYGDAEPLVLSIKDPGLPRHNRIFTVAHPAGEALLAAIRDKTPGDPRPLIQAALASVQGL